jgi:hypothetical protein
VAVLAEQQQLGVGPDVARVGRDKERQIADQPHASIVRVALETVRLASEQELREPDELDLIPQLAPRLG